jgi:hypothetical protein
MAQQLADQRAAVLDSPRARDQWIETAGPAASRELGLIDGRVGQVHQPAGVGGVIGAGRDAGAVDAKAVDLDRPDRLADPLRDLEAGLRIRPGQEDPELFAPRRPARSLARGTCRSRLATARRTSSPRMPAGVIQLLEPIEIQDDQGEARLALGRGLGGRGQGVVEGAVIGQTGERVGGGQGLET